MSVNLDIKTIIARLQNFQKLIARHAVFAAVLIVLIAYLFMVWKINSFATAEPSAEAQAEAEAHTKIPKVDQKAIQQIQSLEKSSPDVHSLFNSARTNPFQE
jgi:hypothetical protein